MDNSVLRAKQLLQTARHAAMATVNEDNTPHNTPYRFLIDDTLECLYWSSHPESQHSQNIAQTGEIFVVLYEADKGGGLYIKANQAHELQDTELETALEIHNKYRVREGKQPLPVEYYTNGPQKMYGAKVTDFYVNTSEKNEQDWVVRDYRKAVDRDDLKD